MQQCHFLWEPKHSVYAAVSFSANMMLWCSRNDTHIFTSAILHMNIIFVAQWLFGGNFENFTLFRCVLHAVRIFVNQRAFSSKHVSTFFTAKYDAISQLGHSYAKDPFCLTRLKCFVTVLVVYKSLYAPKSYNVRYVTSTNFFIYKCTFWYNISVKISYWTQLPPEDSHINAKQNPQWSIIYILEFERL